MWGLRVPAQNHKSGIATTGGRRPTTRWAPPTTDYGCRLLLLSWSSKFDARSDLFSIAYDRWDFRNTAKNSLSQARFWRYQKKDQWSWAIEKRSERASNLLNQFKRYFCVGFFLSRHPESVLQHDERLRRRQRIIDATDLGNNQTLFIIRIWRGQASVSSCNTPHLLTNQRRHNFVFPNTYWIIIFWREGCAK